MKYIIKATLLELLHLITSQELHHSNYLALLKINLSWLVYRKHQRMIYSYVKYAIIGLQQAIDNIKFKCVQSYFTRAPSIDLRRNSSKGLFH